MRFTIAAVLFAAAAIAAPLAADVNAAESNTGDYSISLTGKVINGTAYLCEGEHCLQVPKSDLPAVFAPAAAAAAPPATSVAPPATQNSLAARSPRGSGSSGSKSGSSGGGILSMVGTGAGVIGSVVGGSNFICAHIVTCPSTS